MNKAASEPQSRFTPGGKSESWNFPGEGEHAQGLDVPRRISLLRYSPALVLFAIVAADSMRFADADLWWHLRVGQAILAHGHLPWRNLYSYAAPGYRFIDLEWLGEVFLAVAYNSFGILGLKIFKLLCTAWTIGFLAIAMGETEAPTLVQFAVLLLSGLALSPYVEFRPQFFTFALLTALLAILARETRGRRASLWLAVPIFALWANLHGAFIAGLATLGVFTAVVCARDLVNGRGLSRSYRLFAVTAASTLATLATPYGAGVWRGVLRGLTDPYTHKVIIEWQPLAVAVAGQWNAGAQGFFYIAVALMLFAALGLSLWFAPTSDDLPMVAIAAFMILASILAVRNLALGIIATATPLTRHLGLAVAEWRRKRGRPADPAPERASFGNQLAVTAIAIALAIETGFFSNRLELRGFYPDGAVSFMKEHHLHGKVLDNFVWGGYLIWHLEPASKVFIDGRYDFAYPVRFIGEYLRFHFALPGGAQVLQKYPPDFVLIPPAIPAFKTMESQAGWKLIYRDSGSALFARTDSAAARIPGVPAIATAKVSPEYFP